MKNIYIYFILFMICCLRVVAQERTFNVSFFINDIEKTSFELWIIKNDCKDEIIRVKDSIKLSLSDYQNHMIIIKSDEHVIEIPKIDADDIYYIDVYYYQDMYNNLMTAKNHIAFDDKNRSKYKKVYFFDFGIHQILTMRYKKQKIRELERIIGTTDKDSN